jgi:hypothetical protein
LNQPALHVIFDYWLSFAELQEVFNLGKTFISPDHYFIERLRDEDNHIKEIPDARALETLNAIPSKEEYLANTPAATEEWAKHLDTKFMGSARFERDEHGTWYYFHVEIIEYKRTWDDLVERVMKIHKDFDERPYNPKQYQSRDDATRPRNLGGAMIGHVLDSMNTPFANQTNKLVYPSKNNVNYGVSVSDNSSIRGTYQQSIFRTALRQLHPYAFYSTHEGGRYAS